MNYNGLLELVSLFIIKTPITQKEFTRQLRYALAHTAKRECNQSIDLKNTASKISSLTGLTRTQISDLLDEDPPKESVNKESLILSLVWKIKDDDDLVDIKGDNSFYGVCRTVKLDYSPDTALNSLIKADCIEISCGRIKVLKSKMILNKNNNDHFRILNKIALKLTQTIMHNMENDDLKMFQSSMSSKSIKPVNIHLVHQEIFNYLKNTVMPSIRKILEKYEEENNYNYPEYIVSIFENFKNLIR